MNNHGQNGQAPINLAMQLLPSNGIITPEQFRRNADQIARAREALAVLEQQNAEGHTRYLEQELWNRVQAGRQAEAQLAQLQAQQYAQLAVSSKLTRIPSTHNTYIPQRIPQNTYTSANAQDHGQHVPAQHVHSYQEGIGSGRAGNHAQLHQVQQVSQASHHSTGGLNARPPLTQHQHQEQQQQQHYPSMQQYVGAAPSMVPTVPQNQSSAELPLHGSYHRPSAIVQTAQTNAVPSTSSRASNIPMSNPAPPVVAQQTSLPAHPPRSEWQAASAADPGIAIAGAKATYPSQASTSQAPQQNVSADRRAILEAIARDVYNMIKDLSHDLVISVNRFAIDRLKDKFRPMDNVTTPLPPNPQDAQTVSTIGMYIVSKLQNVEAREGVDLLRHVYSALEQRRVGGGAAGAAAGGGQVQTAQQGLHTQPSVGQQAQPTTVPHTATQQPMQIPFQEASVPGKQPTPTRAMSPFRHHDRSARVPIPQKPLVPTPTALAAFVPIAPARKDIHPQAPTQQTPPPAAEIEASSSTIALQREPDTRTIARSILRAFGRPNRAGSHDSHDDDAKKRKRVSPVPTAGQSFEKKQKTGTEDLAVAVADGSNEPPPTISQPTETTFAPPVAYTPIQSHDAVLTTDQPLQDAPSSEIGAADRRSSPDVVEIKTPGAIQIEAEHEHQQLIEGMNNNIQQVNAVLQQLGTAQVTQADLTAASSPQFSSVTDSGDRDGQITDMMVGVQDHALESLPEVQASTSPKKLALVIEQPVAGPSKVPLFLPSSPTDADSPSKMAAVDADGDAEMQDFVPTGLLGLSPQTTPKVDKGKQKAVDTADDDDILFVSPTEGAAVRWRKRGRVESSSEADVVETSDLEEKRASLRSKTSQPRRQVYVLAPSLPPAAVRLNEREQQPTEDEVSRAVVQARHRMHEYHCPWQGCDAVLESAMKLGQHAQLHAGENEQWGSFTCRWGNCSEYYSFKQKLAEHLRRHSFENLVCAYADCQQTFTAPKDLARHHATYHRGDRLKPTTGLIAPSLTSLPSLPEELPSYMSVPRRITKARISPDDHVWLGARVAANITCYVHPGTRLKATVPSRMTRRVAESIQALEEEALANGWDPKQAVLRMARDEYDDWMEFDPKTPSFCSDLDSLKISRMVCNGLILGVVEEPMPEPMPQDVRQEQEAPRKTADGMVHHIEADAGHDASQEDVHAVLLHGDDSSIRPMDIHPNAGSEVAELARRPVEGPFGMAGNSRPTQVPLTAGAPVHQDGNTSAVATSISMHGWTAFRDDVPTV